MTQSIKGFINGRNFAALRGLLAANPLLANEGIPFDEVNLTKAHPLHRICDGVFAGKYTDSEGVELARIFLEYGADVNGGSLQNKKDTPLIAASSLYADRVAILYIEKGADINHAGTHGGTALHWAAWCGRPEVVEKLIQTGAVLNKKCIDFQSTPLHWAIHGLKSGGGKDKQAYQKCVELLLQAGADKEIPDKDGQTASSLINEVFPAV